jgi:hypothetical protein
MKSLMSRFGGNTLIIGKGKASAENLPEDQSLDNMIDNYAKEIIPNHFFISSYDAMPEWMGAFSNLPKGAGIAKVGTIHHNLNEMLFQYDISVTTDVYIGYHQWKNVYAVFIKTSEEELKLLLGSYDTTYDYVLQVFIRGEKSEIFLKNNPINLERILLILLYKMDLNYEDSIHQFEPSKTHVGKLLSKEFCNSLTTRMNGISDDNKLTDLLKSLARSSSLD